MCFAAMFLSSNKPRMRRTLESRKLREFFRRSVVVRWLIALGTLVGLIALAMTGGRVDTLDLTLGQISPRTIVARVDFKYPDQGATDSERDRRATTAPTVWLLSLDSYKRQFEHVRHVIEGVGQLKQGGRINEQALQKLADVWNKEAALPMSASEIQTLLSIRDRKAFIDALSTVSGRLAEGGVVGEDQFANPQTMVAFSKNPSDFSQLKIARVGQLMTARQACQRLMEELNTVVPIPKPSQNTVERMVSYLLGPNLQLDPALSESYREQQKKSVEPVTRNVTRGNVLIERGERLTESKLVMLKAHDVEAQRESSHEVRWHRRIGTAALVVLLFGTTLLILVSQRESGQQVSNQEFALLATIVLLHLGLCHLTIYLADLLALSPSLMPALLPSSFGPMLVGVLIRRRRAYLIAFISSFFLGIVTQFNFAVMLPSLAGAVLGIHFLSRLRSRLQIYQAGIFAGVAGAAVIAVYGYLLEVQWGAVGLQCGVSIVSAFIASLLISALLPLFELLFKVTTDLRWLEMTDLNHPLLRRMVMEAPGTYHHSLVVATLAERACEEIGAHALQARVCAYFHDVGKLKNPEYFCENQIEGENPHDAIEPHMSALIIIAHVKDGVDMAIQHKLVRPVIETIQQHHGTSQVAYFYHRARQQEEDARRGSEILHAKTSDIPRVQEDMYRYPGPRPFSREIGLISLADAIESASRSLTRTTPQKLEALIKEIIEGRIQDGQLDDCSLSVADLKLASGSFLKTLLSMLHTRVVYPKDETIADQPPPAAPHSPGTVAGNGQRTGSAVAVSS
jgi:putative nucleotidyltransferase with HDIG domain